MNVTEGQITTQTGTTFLFNPIDFMNPLELLKKRKEPALAHFSAISQ
jgi:hypothetical protein